MANTNTAQPINRAVPLRWLLVYASVVWVTLQVADIITESFGGSGLLMQLLILGAAAGVPFVFASAVYFSRSKKRPKKREAMLTPEIAAPANLGILSIGVSPFHSVSADSQGDSGCLALTENITALLSRNPRYRVTELQRDVLATIKPRGDESRASVKNVRYFLEGSVRRTVAGVRVTARVSDSRDGTFLWSEKYDFDEEPFESVTDSLGEKIVIKIDSEFTRQEIRYAQKNPTAQQDAHVLYQQAKGKLQFCGWSASTFANAEALLRNALELDPDFAPAHAYLALVLALAHWTRFCSHPKKTYNDAMAEVDRALELGPESSEALGLAGCALTDLGHPERGIPVIERSIELNPASAQAHAALGTANILSGKISIGIEQLEKAVEINPSHPGLAPWASVLSITYSRMGDAARGLEWGKRAMQSDPRYFIAHLALALAYTDLQKHERATQALAEAVRLTPTLSEATIEKVIGKNSWARLESAGISSITR